MTLPYLREMEQLCNTNGLHSCCHKPNHFHICNLLEWGLPDTIFALEQQQVLMELLLVAVVEVLEHRQH